MILILGWPGCVLVSFTQIRFIQVNLCFKSAKHLSAYLNPYYTQTSHIYWLHHHCALERSSETLRLLGNALPFVASVWDNKTQIIILVPILHLAFTWLSWKETPWKAWLPDKYCVIKDALSESFLGRSEVVLYCLTLSSLAGVKHSCLMRDPFNSSGRYLRARLRNKMLSPWSVCLLRVQWPPHLWQCGCFCIH